MQERLKLTKCLCVVRIEGNAFNGNFVLSKHQVIQRASEPVNNYVNYTAMFYAHLTILEGTKCYADLTDYSRVVL